MNDIEDVKQTSEYREISRYYADKRAKRSQVPLINHINEGLLILDSINASSNVMRAFCLHPLFQNDDILNNEGRSVARKFCPHIIMLVMEYRSVANAYLSHAVMGKDGIILSPLDEVNCMLIADKVQNRKDFDLYHLATHENSARLKQYFAEWLDALGITEEYYQKLIAKL